MAMVLLYDLSVNYHRWEIGCDGMCKVVIDGKSRSMDALSIESNEDFLYIADGENYITPQKLEISDMS
jgi:hypothetical protein